jgi:hypothetical protein
MSNHDLITDLISGRLSPEEQQVALARIAEDPTLQNEYKSQLAVAARLRDAPAPTMTPGERSALRASLMQQLHLDDASASPVTMPSRRHRWWAPAMGLAAAAAVIVGAIIVLPGGGSDDTMEFAAADVTTTTTATEQATAAGGSAEQDQSNLSGDSLSNDAGAAPETTTTAAAAAEVSPATGEDITSTTLAGGAPQERSLPYHPDLDLERLGLAYAAGPEEFNDELSSWTSDSLPIDTTAVEACLEASGNTPEAGASMEIVVATTVDGTEAVVIALMPPGTQPYLVALDVGSCRVLASTGP